MTKILRRSGISQFLVQMGLGAVSLALLSAFGVSFQQSLQDAPPKLQQESVIPPSPSSPQNVPTENFKNDPLFLEIQKVVQAGSTPSEGVPSKIPSDSISNSRWHAVESILTAARMLEGDVAESLARNDVEAGAKIQKTIKTLRSQASELLH